MQPTIALITILTDDVPGLSGFYTEVLGFETVSEEDQYVELRSEGVRFAICDRSVMAKVTDHPGYRERRSGQTFELAFPLDLPEAVDQAYAEILVKGGIPVKAPNTMPWGQRTAFFADPDGNIHELFSDFHD